MLPRVQLTCATPCSLVIALSGETDPFRLAAKATATPGTGFPASSFTTTDVNGPLVDTDASGRSFGAAGGILAMLSSAVGVTSELFYRIDKADVETFSNDTNTFGLAVGIAAFIF